MADHIDTDRVQLERKERLQRRRNITDDLFEWVELAVDMVEIRQLNAALTIRCRTLERRNRQLEERAWGETWIRDLAEEHGLNQIALGQFLVRALEQADPEVVQKLSGPEPEVGEERYRQTTRCQG